MRLSDQLRDDFAPDVRERGLNYLMQGRVKGLAMDDGVLRATVSGAERYRVEIHLEDGEAVEYSCTCPHYEDQGEACKHLWAVLLEADRMGMLKGNGAAASDERDESSDDADESSDDADDSLDESDEEEDEDEDDDRPARKGTGREGRLKWQQAIESLSEAAEEMSDPGPGRRGERPLSPDRRLVYVLDTEQDDMEGMSRLFVRLLSQARSGRGGKWGPLKPTRITRGQFLSAPDPADRSVARMLVGATVGEEAIAGLDYGFEVDVPMLDPLIDEIVATGRCFLLVDGVIASEPLELDVDRPWQLRLRIEADDADCRSMRPVLYRDGVVRPLQDAFLLTESGHTLFPEAWARVELCEAWHFVLNDDPRRPIRFPAEDLMSVLKELPSARPPPLMVDEACGLETTQSPPTRVLVLRPPAPYAVEAGVLQADLRFAYPDRSVPAGSGEAFWLSADQKTLHERDHAAEQEAIEQLLASGWRRVQRRSADEAAWELSEKRFFASLRQLVSQQWRIEREGKPLRNPGRISISVSSGIDWFDLSGHVQFDDFQVPLPELLKALRQKRNTVVLADGSQGVVPAELLEQQALLMSIGRAEGDVIRYEQSQVGVLASLLESVDESRADETFNAVLRKIERFESPAPSEAPDSFVGTLRPYQREGLGWIEFLEECRLGGCLADDMGLGKTIQVLAMLEKRRLGGKGPSLAVVPKSLVFNWRNEAARFTPDLAVIDHTGADRPRDARSLLDYNLVLTTYGTLRRDIGILRDVEFDYLILDESQAIKNASSQSAKSAKLLRGRNRLALSGTPIENSISDLWSLMDFLNPGLLGTSSALARALGDASHNVEARRLLARAVRPMVLRRTKQQVATDLPARTEQTLLVELEPQHRELYEQMRQHYRAELLGQTQVDLNRSKLIVLESLLRLRQLACHPGLLDPKQQHAESAKISALLEQLEELLAEGHKALVFSQFTSLLALLQPALRKRGIVYEYLDGQTRDRQKRVQRFQEDEHCKLFLISLKAGGVGLNLTAADYVFLLDPWWNPAVEAQAIDRAHRIGQTRPVIAYRIIAQDTVEEKVLKLQQSKRELADAIINGGDSVLSTLSREDLELLLS
jgi:hypothetical protein